ncbi:MAG: tetratricopeptide repeat protein, partial [Planctomycetota bacterium]
PPRKGNPGVPRDLETICLKCLEKNPARRYASGKDLAADLNRLIGGKPILARPTSALEKMHKILRRHRAVTALLVLVALLLLAGLSAAVWGLSSLRRTEEMRRATEADKKQAEIRGDEAAGMLEKAQRAASILRSAHLKLAETHTELKRSLYSPVSSEEKRKVGMRFWRNVEEAEPEFLSNDTSRATWFAYKGWLRQLAGFPEDAYSLFREARRADPEVVYGSLFECLALILGYVENQPPPVLTVGRDRIRVKPVPMDTVKVRSIRRKIEGVIEHVSRVKFVGEFTSRELREILDGIQGMETADLAKAEEGLTKALSMAELSFLKETLLFARAQVRYGLCRFREGRIDVEAVLVALPDFDAAHLLLGNILVGEGVASTLAGRDARSHYRNSIEALSQAIALAPERPTWRIQRAIARIQLAGAETKAKKDPFPILRGALEDCTFTLRNHPDLPSAHVNFAIAHQLLGEHFLNTQRGSPLRHFREGLAAMEKAVALKPNDGAILLNMGSACVKLARFGSVTGNDPLALSERAIRCLDRVPEADRPKWWTAVRGTAHVIAAHALLSLGKDPTDHIQKGTHDLEAHLKEVPGDPEARSFLAKALLTIGEWNTLNGKNAEHQLKAALEAFDALTKQNPRSQALWVGSGQAYRQLAIQALERLREPWKYYFRSAKCFEKAIHCNPALWGNHILLGDVLDRLGRYEEALGAFRAAHRIVGEQHPSLNRALKNAELRVASPPWRIDLALAEYWKKRGKRVLFARLLYL